MANNVMTRQKPKINIMAEGEKREEVKEEAHAEIILKKVTER